MRVATMGLDFSWAGFLGGLALERPVWRDGFWYASDGRIVVRVSGEGPAEGFLGTAHEARVLDGEDGVPGFTRSIGDRVSAMTRWEPWRCCFTQERIFACETCLGRRVVRGVLCSACDGTGKGVFFKSPMGIVTPRYFETVAGLVGAELGLFDSVEGAAGDGLEGALAFRFLGGEGLVMPVRRRRRDGARVERTAPAEPSKGDGS